MYRRWCQRIVYRKSWQFRARKAKVDSTNATVIVTVRVLCLSAASIIAAARKEGCL